MGLKRSREPPLRTRLFTSHPGCREALAATPVYAADALPATPAPTSTTPSHPLVSLEERHRLIATAAYRHAERTGFATDPVADWLLAEREIDAQLSRKAS